MMSGWRKTDQKSDYSRSFDDWFRSFVDFKLRHWLHFRPVFALGWQIQPGTSVGKHGDL